MDKGVLLKFVVLLSAVGVSLLPIALAHPVALEASAPQNEAGTREVAYPSDQSPGIDAVWWKEVQEHVPGGKPDPDGLPSNPDWSADGNQADAHFGISVAGAGDVNGDGYDDVIVGAPDFDGGATNSGRAYVFHGSATGLSTTPDWIADAPKVEEHGFFGIVVGPAGDVNGDGYADVAIGMTNYGLMWEIWDEGAVYVWYGSETGLGASYGWIARGGSIYAHLGWDLGTAGDVNGDGYDDLIAGAYRFDAAGASHAYVWYGSATGLGPAGTPGNAAWTASSDQTLSAFGTHVGSAGDVNGDGYGDVFVGAPAYDHGETDEGMVFVWYGSDTGLGANGTPANAGWAAESNQENGQLSGRWNSAPQEGGVGTAGDVNGDGYDDFIVGSNLYDSPDADEGAVFLWYGSATGLGDNGNPGNAGWWAEGDQAGAWFGSGAGTARDVNGDGYDDVLIGGCLFEGGLAAAWLGSEDGLEDSGSPANADWSVTSGQSGSYFGYALATAGDVNGDELADVVVGAHYYDNGEDNEGSAFAYYGQPNAEPIEGLTATNDSPTLLGETTTLTATITSGSMVSYTWAFGDGETGMGPVLGHGYGAAGVYTAVVTATNAISEASASTIVTIVEAIDGLSAVNDSPTLLGETTTLTATITSGTMVTYTWAFGDGQIGMGPVVGHDYAASGSYMAVVTATNLFSQDSASTIVTVGEAIGGLSAVNDSPTVLAAVTTLTATVTSGSSIDFVWSFGDGTSGAGPVASHIYPDMGVYTATITASNSFGQMAAHTTVRIVGRVYLPAVLRQFP